MPINFDPNSLNSVFDRNFGAGSFNAGLSNAANAARLKQQANFAKTDYLKRLKAAQSAATKAAKASTKKTYQDAVDSLNNDSTTLDQIRQQGAYKAAEDIKNDPVKKQAIKDQGYTVSDYIDAMYNAASNGKFRSEREYNGYANQLGKDTKAANKASQDTVSTSTQDTSQTTNTQQQQKKSSPSLLSKIGNGLKGIGSEIGAAATAAEQFVNPFDKVSADQAVKNYMNRNQSQGFQEVARGANRAVDSASLGLMSNLDKKLNNRTPYYNSQRAFGQGGGTDMITSGLGFLVPGVGAAKGVKALGLGAKSIPTLEKGAGLMANLARGSQVARTVAKEGALVGGALPLAQMGINYAVNPKDQNLMNNLTNVGLGIGLGAVGDPILRGLGSAGGNVLAKFAKGEVPTYTGKPSQATLDALTPKLQQGLNSFRQAEQQPLKSNISQLPLNQSKVLDNIQALTGIKPKQASNDVANSPLLMSLNPAKNKFETPISKTMKDFKTNEIPSVEIPGLFNEPNVPKSSVLQDVLKEYGITGNTPEDIAKAYNQRQWYHGTGTNTLTKESLDPLVGDHQGLFGHGIYMTDSPEIAKGYANSRGKRTSTPTIYDAKVNMNRVLDLERPIPSDAKQAVLDSMGHLDYSYNHEFGVADHFSKLVENMANKGATTEEIIQKIRQEITDFSHEAGISTSNFVEDFQDLAVNLKKGGYDGITHTGGGRTGHDPHRVLIALDPNDWYAQSGRIGQVTDFNPNNPAELLNSVKQNKWNQFSGNPDTSPLKEMLNFLNDGTKKQKADVSKSPLLMSLNPAKTAEKLNPKPNLTPVEQEYQNELNQAVQQQVDYLKNSMGKGVDHGTTSNGQPGNFKEVTGTYSVSQNPKWYQDFYKANGRKPNNAELQQLAKEHVLNGFQDEYGNIPSFVPKKIQDINDQIDQAMTVIKQQPEQAPILKPYLDALAQEKTTAEEEYKQFLMKTNLQMFGKNEPKATNISPKSAKNDVTAPNPLDNHGYGLALANEPKAKAAPMPKPNPLDAPYKPGEDLPNTMGQIGTKTVKQPTSLSHTVDKLKIKTVDNLHRLSQFDKQVEKVFGRELKSSESTHTLGLNSRGSDQISKQILVQNMVDKNGEVVGKSLKEIASSIPKGKLSQFEDYLINKHAITRMKRGEKVFPDEMKMTTGKAAEKVKQYEATNPQFKDLAKQVYDYNKQLGQKWLVDTGILSKSQWEGYLKENPHYVPNNRIFSDLEMPKFGNSAKKGFANQSNPVKKATGSQRQIVSPIESMIEHTAQYVKTAKRNEVMQSLINNIKQDPEAFKDWAEIIPTKDGSGTFLDSISNKLKNEGIDGVLEEFNKAFDQKPDLAKGNVVAGIIDGKKVHIRVHDVHLLDAITNLQPKAQNLVISALGQVTRVMKNLTTGINPVFSLTRNIFRDIPTAYVNSKSTNNPLTFSKDLVQSIVSIMKNDSLYKSFKAVGGGHSSPISSDVNLLAQSKQAILPQKGIKPLLGKGLGALENLNNAVESAPRLAEFKRLAGNSYDSKMKALYEANDVTVNFNKYGNWAKEVDAVVPYFNAAIQGLDKQWRVLASPGTPKAEKITAAVKAFVGITIPTMLLYNVNHNDPNYQKVSNYVKDTNLLIPKGDGTFYKIPKPRELGVMFGSDVERVLRAWQDSDPKAFQDFATTIMDTFAPPVRTVLAPFSDLRANKNFANAPIVPQDLQGLSPRYQYDSKTSGPAKAIGNLLNVSPKQIDYLTKSYGGILGELGIPATTKDTTIADTLKQKVTVDPVFSNDLQRNFYDMKTKLDQAHSDLSKQGVQNPNLNEGLRKFMNTQATQMSKVRKQMKTVQNDSSLTPDERLRRLRMLQDQINQIAASANQLSR